MEFITILHPSQKNLPRLRRQAHSHAARIIHARARQARRKAYAQLKGGSPDAVPSPPQPDVLVPGPVLAQGSVPASISSAFEHEPLASFRRSLTAREHFLFDVYVTAVAPEVSRNCPVLNVTGVSRGRRSHNTWTILTTTNSDLLRGSLLSACRWLSAADATAEREYAELAVQYKMQLVRDLRCAIDLGGLSLSRGAVSKAIVLALDEITICDLPMAKVHLAGALQIVKASGGVEALGLSELVRLLLSGCVGGKNLLDPAMAVDIPRDKNFLDALGM